MGISNKAKKMSEDKAEQLLKRHGIPFARHMVAKTPQQAVDAANTLEYPVVLKVLSKDVLHKTETGGVLTDVRNDLEVYKAFADIQDKVKRKVPNAKIDGVMVQHMFPGREVIIGARRDPQFGPVIMFGLGGIFVEVMKDVSFRLLPIDLKEIRKMMKEIKGYPVLKGVRGQKPIKFSALEKCLFGVSKMMLDKKSIQEMDLNPVMVDEKRATAVDVRILEG